MDVSFCLSKLISFQRFLSALCSVDNESSRDFSSFLWLHDAKRLVSTVQVRDSFAFGRRHLDPMRIAN